MKRLIDLTGPSLGRRSVLAGMTATAALAGSRGRAAAEVYKFVIIGKDGWLFPIWDTLRFTDVPNMRAVTGLINTTVKTLKRAGIDTVLLMTPAKSRIYREFLPPDQQIAPSVLPRYRMILDALRPSGAVIPDVETLLTNFRKISQDRDLLFFKFDTHWTPVAAGVTATEIAKLVNANLHLPPSATPGTKLSLPVSLTDDSGDLADMLAPADRAKYPPEPYRNWQASDADADLLETDTADVAVIGNSYMNPKWNFAPLLSNQLARPVTLVWKVHSFGPYTALLSYLNGDIFKKQRPKVLVWEFHEVDMQTPINAPGVWGENMMTEAAFTANLHKALGA